jgi:hypothetical protein
MSTICKAVSRQIASLSVTINSLDFSGCGIDAAACRHVGNAAW